MIVKTIGTDRSKVNPSHWRIANLLLRDLQQTARVRLSGFVGEDATEPVDERWYSVGPSHYADMGTVDKAELYITAQATNDRGDFLWLDAQGGLTTDDTGTPAGNADESGTRGEFFGVVPE